jgi:hypothetical protein
VSTNEERQKNPGLSASLLIATSLVSGCCLANVKTDGAIEDKEISSEEQVFDELVSDLEIKEEKDGSEKSNI